MKDHEIRETVSRVQELCFQFRDSQQLRERIANVLVPVLKAALPSDAAQAPLTDEQILRLADACGLYGVRRGALAFAREVLKDAAPVAPQAAGDAAQAPTGRRDLTRNAIQGKALEHGFEYWRAPDAHGVTGTKPQAIELLQDLLGVEVEIQDNGCQVCDGTGIIGAPSYYAPDEGGVPCECCAAPVAPAAAAPSEETEDDEYPPTPESERAAFNGMMRWHLIRLLQAWRYGGDLRAAGIAAFEWARTNDVGQDAFKASERKVKLAAPTPTVAADAVAPSDAVDDLATLVRKLAYSLRRTNPDSALAAQAVDYLFRKNLVGSPMRGGDQAEPRDDSDRPREYCNGTGDVHSFDGEWRGTCDCGAAAQPDERAAFPRYTEWLHLCERGVWSNGVPAWARDHDGHMNDMTAARAVIEELAACATAPQATVKGDERWIERWHGSEPFRGWSIFSGRERIAFIGGDETLSEAVSEIVQAHNCAAVPQAGVTLTDGRILEIGRQFFRPGRDPDAEPQFVKAVRAVLDAARTEARDASQ